MAHVSHKLSNALEGALAGGGDPATSPLYVFGPFLKLIVVAGVAQITFGASIWLVVLTVALVSAMYRLVMKWVTDGSGGSGLSEEEFGGWAVKVNAGITFIEYTLTFLVSIAALVTFLADRIPLLNEPFLGFEYRTFVAIALSIATGWLVNRGPRMAARAFGPATAGVLLLLWALVIATILQLGLKFPELNLQAFAPEYLNFTLGGYARILAVMTGIEIFANLVAAYDGTPQQKSSKAFQSLLIIMGTTSVTMLVLGPAIFQLSDPTNQEVSVFTQTMDQLLPDPLPYVGTLVGVAVLLSAAAASAQGLQNLALGLKDRHYVPAFLGQRNRFEVADKPVWLEVGLVSLCFLLFGTSEETYLAIYAAGVFILLSMTGWAAAKRLRRDTVGKASGRNLLALIGTVLAATLTSVATVIIFEERFFEGAWIYFVMLPILYLFFTIFRRSLGEPTPLKERLGLLYTQRKYLPFFGPEQFSNNKVDINRMMVTLDGSHFAEQALPAAMAICQAYRSQMLVTSVDQDHTKQGLLPWLRNNRQQRPGVEDKASYLRQIVRPLEKEGLSVELAVASGHVVEQIVTKAYDGEMDVLVMSTHGRSGMGRVLMGSVAQQVVQRSDIPVMLVRPSEERGSGEVRFKKLLVPLDGSDSAELALPYAKSLAASFGSDITLLSVPVGTHSVAEGINDYLTNAAKELQAMNISARAIIAGAEPAYTIIDVAEQEGVDLIVMATHGRSGLDRFMLGSVADLVVRHGSRPVFLVPIRPKLQ